MILAAAILFAFSLPPAGFHGLKAEATNVTKSRFAGLRRDHRGARFIGFTRFDGLQREDKPGEIILTSHPIELGIPADEIVLSWNADLPGGAVLQAEARAIYREGSRRLSNAGGEGGIPESGGTRFYNLGIWSDDQAGPRDLNFK